MFKKRILLVTSWVYPHVGGVSSHLQLLALKLGIPDENVVSFKNIVQVQSQGIKRFETALFRHSRQLLKLDTVSLFAKTLSEIIGKTNCDIIHCHDAMATWAAICTQRRSGKKFKIISTVHGPVSRHMVEEGQPPDSPDVKKVIECEKKAWIGADAIIAVDTLQKKIVENQGGDPEKITIIPNAINIEHVIRLASALPLSRQNDRQWIFIPRRLYPKNGVEFAIRALKQMVTESKPLLIIAGDGKEREMLERLRSELELTDDIVFLGNLDHSIMLPLMLAADVVVIPSVPVHGIEEATSIAAIEAMALSKAVVASSIGGLKELLIDGENGVLVPPAEPHVLALAISDLLDDAMKRDRLGKAAHQTAVNSFSDTLWFEKHLKVYSSIMDG